MEIKLSGVVNDSIVDGPGLRLTVFTQGCPHHCPHCHNPQTHDPKGGFVGDTATILAALQENPLLDGITISGGEPFQQPAACALLAHAAHALGLNVWVYTGYTWEELLAEQDVSAMALLQETDVLVDGRFDFTQRSLELLFCGSKNQRLLDVPASFAAGTPMHWKPKQY